MSWQRQPRRVSVLAEMALRQEKVSERLRELRERHALSQEDAARKVGITHRQWQRWESGESMPYPRSLDMVASAFGISVAEFFDPAETIIDPSQLDRVEAKLVDIETMLAEVLQRLGDGAIEDLVSGALADRAAADARADARSGGQSGGGKAAPRKARARGTRKGA